MESCFGRFKKSTIGNRDFKDGTELRMTVFENIELLSKIHRKHSSLGYQSPQAVETKSFPMGDAAKGSFIKN
jgi:hypothetical protein